jgi:hypothetical protein
MLNDATPVLIEDEATTPVPALTMVELVFGQPRAADEELARAAYIRYAREVRAEGGEPSNYHRWLVEYGYDEDEEALWNEGPVSYAEDR